MKKAIDFIGIGCAKCATTSVFNALARHPLIMPPRQGFTGSNTNREDLVGKECFYWDRDVRSYGVSTYHEKHWGELKDNLVYGEFTPDYILFEESLQLIRDYNPDIKLLAIFRNPVERMWSEYKMFLRYARYKITFRELIDRHTDLTGPRIRRRTKTEIWPVYRSCYGRQTARVLELFDRKNLFFTKIEELQDFPATMGKLFNFLGLNNMQVPEMKLNTRTVSDEAVPYYEELMDRFFLEEIEQLESLLGWDCSDWKKIPAKPAAREHRDFNGKDVPKLSAFGDHIELKGNYPRIKNTEFSICTTVKDRNELLIQALPSWLKLPAKEIVIIDWCSGRSVLETLAGFKDGRIKIIRVANESLFPIAKVLNFAVRQTKEDFILKIDSDIVVNPEYLADHRVNGETFYTGSRNLHGPGTFGTVWLTRNMFNTANGYNERLIGWGFEDNDLYERIMWHGYSINRWSAGTLRHIDHPNTVRLEQNSLQNITTAREMPWTSNDRFYEPEIDYIKIL